MNQIPIKNRLYMLPALLFCIGLQGTEVPQTNTELSPDLYNDVSEQAFDDFNRKPKHHHHHHHHNETQQNNPGFLDTSFSGNGYVANRMGFSAAARAVAIQENNKIVVGGMRDDYPTLARYNDNGSLDSTFANTPAWGPGIIIQTSLLKGSSFNAVAIQPDQKIVAVGDYGRNVSPVGKCLLTRYQQSNNGVILDQNFGVNGIVRTDVTGVLTAVTVQANGKIVVAGYNNFNPFVTQIVLARFNIDGTPDTDFGFRGDGFLFYQVGNTARAHNVIIQKDGKIIVVGSTGTGNQSDILVVRFHNNGAIDHSFGQNNSGRAVLQRGKNNSIAYDVAIQEEENGRIIVAGTSVSGNDKNVFTIIGLHPNGTTDTHFGTTQGTASISPRTNNDNSYARSVAIANDKIIVMGYTITPAPESHNYFSLIRLNHNGSINRISFGDQGRMNTLLMVGNRVNLTALPVVGALQDNGEKIILAGNYFNPLDRPVVTLASNHRFAVARYYN